MREIRAHSQRQRIHRSGRGPATPGIPLPQTSTLRSRRHLANMLIASALIFIVCWAPHVFCIFYKNFGYKQYCSKTSVYFNLLLGRIRECSHAMYDCNNLFSSRLLLLGHQSGHLLGAQPQLATTIALCAHHSPALHAELSTHTLSLPYRSAGGVLH